MSHLKTSAMAQFGVVFITAPSIEEAEKIAASLLEKHLVACVNIFPEIRSLFWWEGELCKEKEVFLMAKTTTNLFDDIAQEVRGLHSYDVPEIIMLPIQAGTQKYLDWIKEVTKVPAKS
jgi:periplasmic divalent cation tolerance protein